MKLPDGVRAGASIDRYSQDVVYLELGGKTLAELKVVTATEQHRNFILSTWVRSYQSTARRIMDKDLYAKEEALVAESFWHLSKVAVSPEDEYVIHGWVCASSDGNIYHAYVPPDFRRRGIASAILNIAVSGSVPGKLQMARPTEWQPKGYKTEFNPYILRGK
jgi:ribosomal protein S18 acetylase RimI-like enzyme